MQKTWVKSLGQEDPVEKGMATYSSILAWRIPWTEAPDGLQFMGSQRAGHNWATNTRISQVALVVKNLPANAGDIRHRFNPWVGKIPWRRAWQPASVFLPGESHGQRSLAGCSPWGCRESDTTDVT